MKYRSKIFTTLFAISLILLSSCSGLKSTSGKRGMDLNYKFVPGQAFTMINEGTSRMESDQQGQTVTVDISSSGEMLITPKQIKPDGTAALELEYKALKQSAQSPMGDGDTDYSSWIGKKVQFSVSPKGTLSDYSGFDKLPDLATATGETVTGDLMKRGMDAIFMKLPDHVLKIGETWTEDNSQDIPYAGKTLHTEGTNTYTVKGKVKKNDLNCLQIDMSGIAKMNGELEQQGMKLILTRETKATGTLYFAIEKGMIIASESNSIANGDVEVVDMGMMIPQKITSNSTSTVVFK